MRVLAMIFCRPPKVGATYCLRGNEKDPFTRDNFTVKVSDVQEGWVLYSFCRYPLSNRNSLSVRTFNFCYAELKEAAQSAGDR